MHLNVGVIICLYIVAEYAVAEYIECLQHFLTSEQVAQMTRIFRNFRTQPPCGLEC